MYNLDFDSFMKYNRHQYKYIYRKDDGEWINDSFQYIDDTYFSLYWNQDTIKDGNQRRKKLYSRMCLRRIMYPEVDADTLLFCAYVDRERFIDNSDEVVSIECLKKNVQWAMDKDIDDLKEEFSDSIEYLKKNAPKRGKIYKNRESIKKGNYTEIDFYYNYDLSVSQNLEILHNNGINISKSSLYNYLKDNNIQLKPTNEEIYSLLDLNLSIRKNKQLLLDNYNISISIGKLSNIINQYNKQ
jgi:DNA polymerase I-like protein with 3'-5' exonuclease and polymerase domains